MLKLWHLSLLFLTTSVVVSAGPTPPPGPPSRAEYDYIVVGSGPGGGPLAANLAKAGHSVLLVEAGDDQGHNLKEQVGLWGGLAMNDPEMRWDFFVKYHSDEVTQRKFNHLTWRLPDGQFWVGRENPPEGAVLLGVYYPRAGTLGGCSTHNGMAATLGSNSDWDVVAELTGDKSWSAKNMRKHLVTLEKNNYLPPKTKGHGFSGYLDMSLNNPQLLTNRPQVLSVLKTISSLMSQDPSKILTHLTRDLNSDDANRDNQLGVFGMPAHMTTGGKRVSARAPVDTIANATTPHGKKKYKLTVQTNTFVTKVLFDRKGKKGALRAIGVDFLQGKSMYSADPRYNASNPGLPGSAYARKEVILSGGVFNTPQILKLSGIGPRAELQRFNIPVLVDLPGVGANMQDNYEVGVIGKAATNFTDLGAMPCTFGNGPSDPCLDLWRQGKGPYARSQILDSIMYKTKNAAGNERDLFMWADAIGFRGFWPNAANIASFGGDDGPNTFTIAMVKMHTYNRLGTVTLTSADPRVMPEINFRFFEDRDAEKDLKALEEGIEFGRKVLRSVQGELAPMVEAAPCNGGACDVREHIKTQAWSHHATSTCAIGGDRDPMAVLDSRFRVRGVERLRVVDGSAFPRIPGAFPVLPTFILSEKATEVILADAKSL